MRDLLFTSVLLACIFSMLSPSFATTSCMPHFTFIGISKSGDVAYFEGAYAGECTAALTLYKFDPREDPKVSIATRFDMAEHNIPNWDFEIVQGKGANSENREVADMTKRRFWRTNFFPAVLWNDFTPGNFTEQDKGRVKKKISLAVSAVPQTVWFMQKKIPFDAIVLGSGNDKCFFPISSAIFREKEEYLAGAGKIVRAYHLYSPEMEKAYWLIITEHPNVGSSGDTSDAVSVYDPSSCEPIK